MIKVFENFGIKINDEKILLIDLIKQTKSTRYASQINRETIKKYDINGHAYISIKHACRILKKYSTLCGKKILSQINLDELSDNTEEEQIEDAENNIEIQTTNNNELQLQNKDEINNNELQLQNTLTNIFKYANKTFTYYIVNDKIYFKGKEIAEYLEYSNLQQAIREHVDNDEKYKLKNLGVLNFRPLSKNLKNISNEENTIYISESGLYSLIIGSKKKEAKEFKKHICNVILPSIRKTGSYSENKNIQFNNNLLLDTSFIKTYFNNNDLINYENKNVIYLGLIGIYNSRLLIKYGKSSRICDRIYKEHHITFGKQFTILHIAETDNNNIIEQLFEKAIRLKQLNVELVFNNKKQTELFIINGEFNIELAIEMINKLIIENPLRSNEIRDNIINNNQLLIEQEKTKQIELQMQYEQEKTKQLDLELKILQLKSNKIMN